ncbi:HNH endonuclease signature motif containing protein [Nocardioides mangrovi]|uniref:HNH endonuclease n=1 Tax=Nocardioides mangrovi TaxID=2874580 RepID=A0ABS7UIJ7_9ACTN|nr:HNH endonuclease signature motif containing protein [Nocardioides mangrovi]MBZ5740625.1 HNH endonuclease [Nocardioides mangrovi]
MVLHQATPAPTPGVLLAAVEDVHAGLASLDVDLFSLAAQWAEAHPGELVDASVPWHLRPLEVAGDGAPTVDEACIAEFALATGRSTDGGRAYLGDAVECRWGLPKLWEQVMAGRVPVWKARRVADLTRSLPLEGATFVDAHISPVIGHSTWAQLERTVEEARVRFDPAEAEARRIAAAEDRHFDIDLAHVTYDGVVHVDGDLDLADATLLDEAVTTGAAELAALGSLESLHVRRSQAAGLLARRALSGQGELDLTIYVHISPDDPVAHVEHTRSIVAVEQVESWCRQAGTTVTVRPVLDLNEELRTDAYAPTDRLREQVVLTNPTCILPGCRRPARRADLDHLLEHERGGPTGSVNLAPECRGHHRIKTHTDWTVTRTGPATFAWTSPHGRVYTSDTTAHHHRRRAG